MKSTIFYKRNRINICHNVQTFQILQRIELIMMMKITMKNNNDNSKNDNDDTNNTNINTANNKLHLLNTFSK